MKRVFEASGISEAVVRAYYKAVDRFLPRPEVTAIDVGYARKDGNATDEVSVRVHVNQKLEPQLLDAKDFLPKELDGIRLDVIASRFEHHDGGGGMYNKDPRRCRPRDLLRPGVSIGDDREVGTIGMFVRDDQTDVPCLLSAAHVIASRQFPDHTDPIHQPGKADGPGAIVGRVHRWHRFTDSAVALLADGTRYDNKPFGRTDAFNGVRLPVLGDILEKSGRTTGITQGRVEGVGQTYDGVGHAFYLVPIEANVDNWELTWKGDSGAIWFDPDTMEVVGLHAKGEADPNPLNEYAVASCLEIVFEELQVRM